MSLSRRDFLKVIFAAGLATAIPVTLDHMLKRPLPEIWGDGVHDDTAGIQAACNGEPFYARNDCVTVKDGTVSFRAGTYRTSGIQARMGDYAWLSGATLWP